MRCNGADITDIMFLSLSRVCFCYIIYLGFNKYRRIVNDICNYMLYILSYIDVYIYISCLYPSFLQPTDILFSIVIKVGLQR